jgi:hypothetical protein
VDYPKVVARLLFHTNPVAYARQLLVQVVMVQITASQLCPKVPVLIHEQQLVAVDRRYAGDGIRRFAVCPLCKPVAPAQFTQFTILIHHLLSIIEWPRYCGA